MSTHRVYFKSTDNGTTGSVKVNAFDEDDAILTAEKYIIAAVKTGKIRPTVRVITGIELLP